MRPSVVVLPLSVVLALVGAYLVVASAPKADQPLVSGPRHPVTTRMQKGVDAQTKEPSPDIALTAHTGESWNLKDALKTGPVFAYFILDGCPCSVEAEPLYHRLAKNAEKATVVGIITSKAEIARKWVDMFKTPYPVLSDADGKVAAAFKAERSAYSAIITQEGTIDRMWAGYSESMLQEANRRLAELTGVESKPLDTAYAPQELSSGCSLTEGVGK